MSENQKKWIKRAVLLAVDLILAFLISYSRFKNPPIATEPISIYHSLADGFFVVGFFNVSLGILVKISNTGFFDIFGFAFRSILNFFIPRSLQPERDSYYEYKVKKEEKRKKFSFFAAMLVIGVTMIGLSILFSLLLYV